MEIRTGYDMRGVSIDAIEMWFSTATRTKKGFKCTFDKLEDVIKAVRAEEKIIKRNASYRDSWGSAKGLSHPIHLERDPQSKLCEG